MDRQLLNDLAVAERLGISRSLVRKLHALGKLPAPVRLNRCVRWRVSDLDLWAALDCPARDNPKWLAALAARKEAAHV